MGLVRVSLTLLAGDERGPPIVFQDSHLHKKRFLKSVSLAP